MKYELSIKCKNCTSQLHKSCIKSHEQEFITIVCNCKCNQGKNGMTDKDSTPISVTLNHSTIEVTEEND